MLRLKSKSVNRLTNNMCALYLTPYLLSRADAMVDVGGLLAESSGIVAVVEDLDCSDTHTHTHTVMVCSWYGILVACEGILFRMLGLMPWKLLL